MMGWFGLPSTAEPPPPEILTIPLFPLNTVLFPDSLLPLKIFEQRYLDMAASCMKDSIPFGICLIAHGEETGQPAQTHPVGTLAHISQWEMEQLGILMITARGGKRFHILESKTRGLLLEARVELLQEAETSTFPHERKRLLPLLRRIVADLGPTRIAEPHRFDDATWVGNRITEILPIQNLAKQKLLELDDPIARLEILEKYLDQRQLLG